MLLKELPPLTEMARDSHHTYVDPQTGYEYANWCAFATGKDPIPHWRNAQIRKIRQTFHDEHTNWRVGEVQRLYDRQGTPIPSRERDEEVFRCAPHPFQPQCWLSSLAG